MFLQHNSCSKAVGSTAMGEFLSLWCGVGNSFALPSSVLSLLSCPKTPEALSHQPRGFVPAPRGSDFPRNGDLSKFPKAGGLC